MTLFCPECHELGDRTRGHWVCDECDVHFSPSEPRLGCAVCDYDICQDCEHQAHLRRRERERQRLGSTMTLFCPEGHELRNGNTRNTRWVCDECRAHFSPPARRLRCFPCDYDICHDCEIEERALRRERERRRLSEELQRERDLAEAAQERARRQMQAQLEADRARLEKDRQRVVEEVARAKQAAQVWTGSVDPDRFMRKQQESFNSFCAAASVRMERVQKQERSSIAVMGPSGVGKSTILNAIAGRKVAEVGVTECTQEISMVHRSPDYDMYDVPGSRDERADFYNIENLRHLKSLHCIMVVYTDRFEHVLNIAKLLRSINSPHIFVRNKCNFARNEAGLKRAYQQEQLTAGRVPLVFLGYIEKDGDVPDNLDQLKMQLREVLESSR